jgi:hypothetical protein
MTRSSLAAFGLAFLGVAAAGADRAAAGVQVLSQDGFVRARVAPGRGEPLTTDQESAPSSGSFTRAAQALVAIDGFAADARSNVDATLGQDGFTFAGALAYEATDTRPDDPESGVPTVRLDYEFHVTFSIDEAYDYDFQHTRARNDTYPFNELENLHQIRGVDVDFLDVDANGGGTLQPGTYELTLAQTAEGLIGPGAVLDFDYEVALDLTPVDGNGNGGGTPIPLPPAVWSGLLVLGAGAANRMRKRLMA